MKNPLSAANLLLSILIFLTGGLHPAMTAPGEAAEVARRLGVKVENYTLDTDSLLQALAEVASQFEIPMGIQMIANPEALAKVRLSWKRATAQQVIAALAQTPPGYRVEVKGGVIHIRPRRFPGSGRNFLQQVIPRFQVRGEVVELANRRLFQLVNAAMRRGSSAVGTTRGGGTGGSLFYRIGEQPLTVNFVKVTVEEILDRFAASSDERIWVVVFPRSNALTATGFQKTCSWNGKYIPPDSQQPTWDMFTWREDPTSWRPRPDWKPVLRAASLSK